MSEFGRCPKCKEWTLVRTRKRLHYYLGGAPGDLVEIAKCVNCGWEGTIRTIPPEEEENNDEEDD